ncbi:unnamed protein product [Chrysoparadoxa australica]
MLLLLVLHSLVAAAAAMAEVLVVGSINVDLSVYTSRLPLKGETITGKSFKVGNGGKGANQAVMASKMGVNTSMVAKVGQDSFGKDYLTNLKETGLDCTYIATTDMAPTGIAQICVDDEGGNTIVIVPGANHLLSPADLTDGVATAVASCKVLLCQLEVKQEVTLEALKLAKASPSKVFTILNPAPAPPSGLLDGMLCLADMVCPNETELELLTGTQGSSATLEGVEAAARTLLEAGAGCVVVTLGERGCLMVDSQDSPAVHVPAEAVTPVDTVGAGDCWLGALASHIARGTPLKDALTKASAVAAMSVQGAGAQESYPSVMELPPTLRIPSRSTVSG